MACGKCRELADPLLNNVAINANYQTAFLEISSLGQQVSTAAQEHFPEIFCDVTIKDHPLRSILEWITLKRTFNPLHGADPSIYWDKLNEAISKRLQLTPSFMRAWISDITTSRNNLVQIVSADAVDSVIKGKILGMLKAVKHADPTVALTWMIKANKWGDDYEQNPASITWTFLKTQILKEISKFPDTPATAALAPRPRINPAVPANVALYTNDDNEQPTFDFQQIAYHAAMAAL